MLYKFYKNIFKTPPPAERRALFGSLYKKFGVELIGLWKNQDNPLEYFMITKYRDENHHKEFVAAVKEIPEYIAMTKRISEVRISSESINLIEAE